MDKIELKRRLRSPADTTQGFEEVRIFVNGIDLAALAGEVERPYAEAEGHPDIAGQYAGLPPDLAYLPSRHLLGKPVSESAAAATHTPLLRCECGEWGCWPLLADVVVKEASVQWRDFRQPHRPAWDYRGLGPFVFDRAKYEVALNRPSRVS